jgi:lysine/ornithine N-monooxygenase
MTVYITIMNKKLLLLLFICTYLLSSSQDLVLKSKFPINNVKNFYVLQNDKKQILLHSYNYSKINIEIVDNLYKSIYSTTVTI